MKKSKMEKKEIKKLHEINRNVLGINKTEA